jgi:hypothetical protein
VTINNRPSERRIGVSPIPKNVRSFLTEAQHACLSRLEGIGWTLQFVRSEGLLEPVIIVVDPSGEQYGVLREDGQMIKGGDLRVRWTN